MSSGSDRPGATKPTRRDGRPADAHIGQSQRFFPVVRHEQGARSHDARVAPLPQRREIGVDDRMLEVRERCVRRLFRSRLGARQHEAVARLASPLASGDRKGRLPDPIDEVWRRRIENVSAAKRLACERAANNRGVAIEDRRPVALSRPKPAKADGVPPEPSPSSRRPFETRSNTAASSATRTGSSSGKVTMPVPRRIRDVRAATWARNTNGAGRPPSSPSK